MHRDYRYTQIHYIYIHHCHILCNSSATANIKCTKFTDLPMDITLFINSALASDELYFPLEPVYFVSTHPLFRYDEFFGSNTSGKVGSNAAFTSDERQDDFSHTSFTSAPKLSDKYSIKSYTKCECSPVLPVEPLLYLQVL